jgi:hypothetical protein
MLASSRALPATRRQAIALAFGGIINGSAARAQGESPAGIVAIEIRSRAIPLFEARDPDRRRFGKLHFRGGLQLLSAHKDFGGLSSVRVDADGERFLAVTDKGYWLRGRITYEGAAPSGIIDAEMAPILAADGRPIQRLRWYDTEALAEDAGIAYVALERVHQILRFEYGKLGLLAPGQPLPVPPDFKRLRSNKGIESLIVVPKGQPNAGALIALAERGREETDNIPGFIIGGRQPGGFTILRSGDYDITDCAATPNGDLLILERHFSYLRGVAMRMRRIAQNEVMPGALLDGPTLIEADMGYQIDNMEALSVHRAPNGDTVLTLLSDDNFSALQRILLLQFTLLD